MSTDTAPAPVYKEGGPRAWVMWVLASAFVVLLFSVQTGYSVTNPDMQESLSLTIGQVGMIAAVYNIVFAITQFFGGALLDILGARKVLTVAVAIVTVGIGVLAVSQNFGMVLLAQLLLATGSCVGFVGAGFVGGDWFGMAKFSVMFGMVQTVASVTSAISVSAISAALGIMTWQALYGVIAGMGVVLFVLFVFLFRDLHPRGKAAGVVITPKGFAKDFGSIVAQVVKIPHVWVSAIGGGLTFGVVLALGVVWGPRMLMAHGLDKGMADVGSAMLWLGLGIGALVIPRLSDKFMDRKWIIGVGNIVQLFALAAILFLDTSSVPVLFTLVFVLGFFNAAHMLAFSTACDVVTGNLIGQTSALVNGVMFVAGAVLMSAPSWFVSSDTWTFTDAQKALMPMLVALVVAAAVGFFMKETYPGRKERDVARKAEKAALTK